jgi:hypothetical protein
VSKEQNQSLLFHDKRSEHCESESWNTQHTVSCLYELCLMHSEYSTCRVPSVVYPVVYFVVYTPLRLVLICNLLCALCGLCLVPRTRTCRVPRIAPCTLLVPSNVPSMYPLCTLLCTLLVPFFLINETTSPTTRDIL